MESTRDSFRHRDFSRLHFGHKWLVHFKCVSRFSGLFAMHFLDEVFFQDVVHIDDLFLLGDTQIALGILSSYAARQPSNLTWIVPPSSFLSFFGKF